MDYENENSPAVYQSREVMEFKAKTENYFQPINGLDAMHIEEIVAEYINTKLYEYDFDATIRDVVLSGSRCRGLERNGSDLDVVVEFFGNEREDDLYNLLHEDKFSIGGIRVDINPITEFKTGTLEEYLPGVEKYLEEKCAKMKTSVREKLAEKKEEADRNSKNLKNGVKEKVKSEVR